jgi:RNA methyltransferase, TrmH family
VITSSANVHVKDIRRLRERKYRLETGLSYIEGIRIVFEAVLQNAQIVEIIHSPELTRSEIVQDILARAKSLGIGITEVSKPVFEYLSSKDGPQGLAAVINQNWLLLDDIDPSSGVWLALYEVADPGNLGTILRSCDAVGAIGVILIDNCVDPYDPTALRASMGGIFSSRVVKCSLVKFVDWVKQQKIQVIGTSDKANYDFRNIKYPDNMVLLMGSERQGIPDQLQEICKTIVSIPMKGKCDSLNLAVATSLVLFEVARNH